MPNNIQLLLLCNHVWEARGEEFLRIWKTVSHVEMNCNWMHKVLSITSPEMFRNRQISERII